MTSDATQSAAKTARGHRDNPRAFLMATGGVVIMIAAALGFGFLLGAPPFARFAWSLKDAGVGVAATAPMAGLLYWFAKTPYPPLARFRDSQIEFFSNIGFDFTPFRIAVMALGAGVSEEMIFRGVFQVWSDKFLPLAAAIILPNIIFGALHARTVLYAVIAGVIGVYLGVLFATTGNLLAPIVVHALYDAIALDYARRAIAERRRSVR